MDNGPVLPAHVHHVGHRADGRQCTVPGEEGLLPVVAPQGQHQLQRHAHPGQRLKGVGTVRSVGVHHRGGVGELLFALVVVGDDEVHPEGFGVLRLLHAGDAAVHRDDEIHALLLPEVAHGLLPQTVAVLQPAGDILDAPSPPAAQIVHQQHGGGDAVHIVVAKDGDLLIAGKGGVDPLHRPVHVLHQEGGVGEASLPLQKHRRLLHIGHPSGGQHRGDQIGIAGVHQMLHRLLRAGNSRPSGVFQGISLLSFCGAPWHIRCAFPAKICIVTSYYSKGLKKGKGKSAIDFPQNTKRGKGASIEAPFPQPIKILSRVLAANGAADTFS